MVPDGLYNIEFKIYQDGDGAIGGGDETLKWTETRESGNKVQVKNGFFSVYLGSVTAFGSSVDWNQDTLWLSINIGGTGRQRITVKCHHSLGLVLPHMHSTRVSLVV